MQKVKEMKDMAEKEAKILRILRMKTLLQKNLEDGKKHFKKST